MENRRSWRISEKHWETPEAVTLTLEPEDGGAVDYLPGQYLSLIRETTGVEQRRAYSFSSCPGVDTQPAITIKRIPNGEFSNWLVHRAGPGEQLVSGPPQGRFLLPEKPPRQLIYAAAGSGITPVISHLKWLLLRNQFPDTSITLFYANRDSGHTIFKNRIDGWIEAFPERFACTYLFSREKGAANALNRHLSNSLFEKLLVRRFGKKTKAAEWAGAHAYLCAPNALMRMAQMTLRVLDFPAENIHQENFAPDTRWRPRTVDTSISHRIIVANKAGQHEEFSVFAGETILSGALRQGIALPYTCKTGVCLTCLARCVRGSVEISFVEQSRLEGPGALINTCIGYPLTDEVELFFE